MSVFTDQKAFMVACGQQTAPGLNTETHMWRRLVKEEFIEVSVAFEDFVSHPSANHKAELAKELVDLIYVSIGMLNNLEIPADEVWAAVHASNMAKVDTATGKVVRREDGKILKPAGWQAPDILSRILHK